MYDLLKTGVAISCRLDTNHKNNVVYVACIRVHLNPSSFGTIATWGVNIYS